MEHDPRPFQSVNIGMTSVETGRERFLKDDFYSGPPLSAWRCNLTALSQRYNLYFVATREGIAVYQPEYPFQKLKRVPKLNIPPTLANDSAAGYIDEWRPHGINHLIVGDLGSEEILLAATDSGNVAAYHTKAIEEAIKKNPYQFSANGRSDFVGVRALFSHWVHESAWGLAIHREGRMIAVSANKPHHVPTDDVSAKVTVFAFALTDQSRGIREESDDLASDAPGEEQEWYDWDPEQSNIETPHRDRNFKITLGGDSGHTNNIPSVSFVNNQEDPDGSWLLSTDITGTMKLWRIWRGTCYASYDCEGTNLGVSMRRQRDAGWIVAALDPSAFRPAMTMDQFCGYHRARAVPQYHGHPGESYDITNIVRLKTPGRSQKHPLMDEDSEDDRDPPDNQGVVSEDWTDEEIEEPPDRQRNIVLGLNSLRLPISGEDSTPLAHIGGLSEPLVPESSSLSMQHEISSPDPVRVEEHSANSSNAFATFDEGVDPDDLEAQVNADDEDGADSLSASPASHTSISSTTQRTSMEVEVGPMLETSLDQSGDSGRALLKNPPSTPSKRQRHDRTATDNNLRIPFIAALQCSQFHVRLINIPKARSPHFFCANILTQDLPEGMEISNYAHLARLSMMQQIPELGIVIIASQLGRCAVCTLTRNISNGALGLRVDWILPTRRQERAGHRPMHPLLGIAVAPIQGRAFERLDLNTEQYDLETWATDRTVHGVKTTFDRNILVLHANAKDCEGNSSSDDESTSQPPSGRHQMPLHTISQSHIKLSSKHTSKPNRKRPRPAHTSSTSIASSSSSQASTESRTWPASSTNEPWSAVESSRRYRLMLTYLDMTVLTYELERGVEREDVRGAESWRAQMAVTEGGEDDEDVDESDD